MYELQNINQDIVKKYYDSIFKAMQKKNWHSIACLSIESTFHEMLPNFPKYGLEKYIKNLLKPVLEAKENNFKVRDFIDDNEREEVYEHTYGDLINELQNSNDIEDKYNLELLYNIYDLLKYDKVVIINDEKYLHSCFYINLYAKLHLKAYNELEISYKQKPSNRNIDTATNGSKDIKDKVAFLNPMFKPAIENVFADNKSEKLKLGFIENYENEYRIIARSVHELARLKQYSDNFEINELANLEPYINSDGHITNHDLYISWYAYLFTIYKDYDIPVTNKIKLAQLSSYVIFPKLRGNEKPIINEKTAIKPIREVAFFKGLRLLDFTDNRTKIKKTDDEIKFTENYLVTVTKYLNKYS
ncbi:hypothetical protein CVO_04685 [Sulfurimonas sp. CVO]|uniref:hypothetical protein n=1 Tax=Sulfurimonas sp. CVO TaxID=2283483 RepID=UPI00132EF21F|nr:hypothetical protein [Sulfurimonas sp. CVO]QHG91177.1 hypothetical protein CVO_04685 [Sulfurimonas sp. CVO]